MPARRQPLPAATPWRELALLLLLASLWGASYSFIRIGVATIPPLAFIAGRTLIAGVVLLALLNWRGVPLPRDRAMLGRFLVQAGLNSVVPFTLIAWAERSIDAGLAVILNATTPVFACLLSLALSGRRSLTGRQGFGVAAGFAGNALIIGLEALNGLGRQLWPQLAMVAATLCYGGAALYGRGFHHLDPMVPAAGSLLCGATLLLPLSLVIDRPWTLSPSLASLAALTGLALLSTALAFVLYFRLIRTLGSVGATAQAYLRVPIGVVIAMLLLDETPAASAWAGLVAVVAGVMAMTLPDRRRAADIGQDRRYAAGSPAQPAVRSDPQANARPNPLERTAGETPAARP